MSALVLASVLRTSLGDGEQTFQALLTADGAPESLRHGDPARLRVSYGHHLPDPVDADWRPSRWLAEAVREALVAAGVDPARGRVSCLVGTGLRESATVERAESDLRSLPVRRLHFAEAVRAVVPQLAEVVTIANACSASGHALALAQDLIDLGEADAVVVAGVDGMTESMLAMIGRVVDEPTDRVRPFDADRRGVLLGEGVAAVVLGADDGRTGALARVLATGLSCDAYHETAPAVAGISRAMRDALRRAGRCAREVGLVLAHGTGTALNDPAECQAIREVLCQEGGAAPLITGVKGAIGHTSGAAALANLDVALRCLATGRVPPVTGLREPLPEAAGLRLVRRVPVPMVPGLVQVNAFGFGGVNSVTLLELA